MDVQLAVADWGGLFTGTVRRYNRAFPPLDLLTATALLRRDGHSVDLVDCRARPEQRPRLRESTDLRVVSLSPLDRWQCPNTDLDQVDRFLEGVPRDSLILAGAQPTLRPRLLLRRTGAHGVVLGEPEAPIAALAGGARPGDAAGTARLDGDHLVQCARAAEDPEDWPLPAFDAIDYADYGYPILGDRLGLLEATRGCPWTCAFCLLDMYDKRYRKKSAGRVAEEFRAVHDAGARCVYFQDLEFTADRARVLEYCEAIRSTGLRVPWACQTRPDTVDEPLLRAMKAAGCRVVHFGVESGAQEVVDRVGKRQALSRVARAMDEARAAGLQTLCYFLIGLPDETREQMERTLRFARSIRPTWASFQPATPYPKTALHDAAEFDEPFPDAFEGPLDADALRALARSFTLRYHLDPRYVLTRLTTPGRKTALREIGLLARYASGRQ